MAEQFDQTDQTELSLDSLVHGFPHLPPEGGAVMAQAAIICLDHQGHESGVRLLVEGAFAATFPVSWSANITQAMRRFWNDPQEATQHGACALAIVLVRALRGYTVIERSRKGTGFDWWLGFEDNLFQAKARLEVSGILRGSKKRIDSRLRAKILQTTRSDYLDLPVYVVVIEFSNPTAKVVQR
jgi:hypothetical protein